MRSDEESVMSAERSSTPPQEPRTMTRELAPHEWDESLDSFSRQHDGWLVTVEILGAELGAQIEGRDLRLRGIACDSAERARISIMLETPGGGHVTHAVAGPAHIWLEQTADGADVALQIESADETRTLIKFRTPARPDQVDGMPRDQPPI